MPSFTTRINNLVMLGPVVEVHLAPPKALMQALEAKKQPVPQPIKVIAMIDTGSTSSVIAPGIAAKLGLNPKKVVSTNTASHSGVECLQFHAAIVFPIIKVGVETSTLIEMPLKGQHIQCLIGRDVLRFGVLIYNGYDQTVTLSL